MHKREWKRHLVVAAPPVDVTSGERTLVRPLFSPADAGTRGVRRSARGVRTVGVGGNTGGWRKRGSWVGRATISKANDLGTGNDESVDVIGPDVGPLEPIVHSGEGGELAGGWLISASVLHVNLTRRDLLSHRNTNWSPKIYIHAAWIVLGLSYGVKSDDLVANQLRRARNVSSTS